MDKALKAFIEAIPKTELHLHLEGTFEPELMVDIAKRNGLKISYNSIEELKAAYNFNNLQEFLDIYYEGAGVLITEQDFYDLTMAYLEKVYAQNVVHVEVFFDPQTHTERGVSFGTVIKGIKRALDEAYQNYGMTSILIMSYLRHLDEASAFKTLEECLPYKSWIAAVGLDSSEVGNPPSKFERVFEASRSHGFKTVAHAGEEGPSDYIWEALDILKVCRIDHGNRCLEDPKLVQRLIDEQMPLTLCPLSNVELKVIENLEEHPVVKLMEKGILATIHSDDPAYFGGYMNENYLGVAEALNMNKRQIADLAINGFKASWLSNQEKEKWINQIEYTLSSTH